MSRSHIPPPVVYAHTPLVAESLARIVETLTRIHSTLQFHGSALDGVSNTLEDIAALMMNNTPAKQMEWATANLPSLIARVREVAQSVREPVKHDDIVSRAKRVVAKAEREAADREAAERDQGPRISPATREALARDLEKAKRRFYAAKKAKAARKPRRKAPNTRQPSED